MYTLTRSNDRVVIDLSCCVIAIPTWKDGLHIGLHHVGAYVLHVRTWFKIIVTYVYI